MLKKRHSGRKRAPQSMVSGLHTLFASITQSYGKRTATDAITTGRRKPFVAAFGEEIALQ